MRLASGCDGSSALRCGIAAPPPLPSLFHSVNKSSKVGRSSSSVIPARRLGAGYPALARTLGCFDRTRRDRDRLRAGDTATLLRAGRSGSAPYRRDYIAALDGGGEAITTAAGVR